MDRCALWEGRVGPQQWCPLFVSYVLLYVSYDEVDTDDFGGSLPVCCFRTANRAARCLSKHAVVLWLKNNDPGCQLARHFYQSARRGWTTPLGAGMTSAG